MALSFTKKAATGVSATAEDVAKASGAKPAAKASTAGFMKTGAAAKAALQEAEARAEMAKQEAGKMWRFLMPEGEDRKITFLDGELDGEGMLDIPMWWEHTLRFNGNWENFACTAEADQTQPCPICAAGDKPALVGALTVIDHTPHTIKSGPNAGKVIKNTRKLYVAKRQTIALLNKLAEKRGGLTGATFDVSRIGDKAAAVGSQFDFIEKQTLEELAAKYGLDAEEVAPANYAEEIRYRSPEELIELGVVKGVGKGGGSGGVSHAAKAELQDQL